MNTKEAHEFCSKHRASLKTENMCGCFYCLTLFFPEEIIEWIDDGQTAICPHCGVDSVISSHDVPEILDENFRKEMCDYWFEGPEEEVPIGE